ncbi:MAG: 3-hydroxyacyl-ACP dehydratase FabZ family protein [Pirellulaceae bacterium]
MVAKDLIFNPADLDFDNPIADLDEICRVNPQRHEMLQLTAIVGEDRERNACAAYKDLSHDEFWVRGHMPGMPLMPGVVMLEAAAQLCSYFTQKHDLLGADMVGFGGVDEVRFRDPVLPGDRLILMCILERIKRGRMIVARFQGVVRDGLAVEGIIKGIPIPIAALKETLASRGQST